MNEIPALVRVFSYLSLLTIGGGMAAFPALKNEVVAEHHWLTEAALIHLYSVGQMAPGPNMMMVASIGEKVAGPLGSLVVVLAFFLPTALITYAVGRLWVRLEHWPWRDSIKRGLGPVSVGLVLAGSITLARSALLNWAAVAIAVAVFLILMRSKINPAYLMLGGAGIGFVAFRGMA
jgi:chromate transporter